MRVLVVSGIFPPDIGGPATHTADLRLELLARGHTVEVLAPTDERSWSHDAGVLRLPRHWPWPVRNALATAWVAIRGRRSDVVYATGLGPPAVVGARVARRPVVLKIVGDPAWERAVRRGLTGAGFDDFQHEPNRSVAVRAMKSLRSWSTRHATAVVTPSEHLRGTVRAWSDRRDVEVVPNGVRTPSRSGAHLPTSPGLVALFAGRLVPWKRVELLIGAVARTSKTRLEIVGDGPEAAALRRCAEDQGVSERVQFLGSLPHDDVLTRMQSADVFVLASSYEGLPHVLIEALACGTPVVATRDAGTVDVIDDEVSGILVDPSPEAFADAFRELAADPDRLARLREGATTSGRDWTMERCTDRLEGIFAAVTNRRPRAVFLGKNAVTLDDDHLQKFAIHGRHLESVVVCSGARSRVERAPGVRVLALLSGRPKLVSTPVFYTVAPLVAVCVAAGRERSAIVCQSPYEAVGALAFRKVIPERWRPRVQVEIHGDWHTATRLCGSAHRRWLSRVSDGMAGWAIRNADRVRVVSTWLADLARDAGYRGAMESHIAFSDYTSFYAPPPRPLPPRPHVLFAGVLERYKGVDVLVDAWPEVLASVPAALLTIIGSGTQQAGLRAQIERLGISTTVTMVPRLPRPAVREMLDRSWCLCLPSRSEGLGRIVLEAMAAGRAVVATRAGGPDELVIDHQSGRLVNMEDSHELAAALVEVLGNRALAEAMGAEGRRLAETRDPLAEYEAGIQRLSCWIVRG
jgi:glycosyltransferase involved in cell wall biosynthesis